MVNALVLLLVALVALQETKATDDDFIKQEEGFKGLGFGFPIQHAADLTTPPDLIEKQQRAKSSRPKFGLPLKKFFDEANLDSRSSGRGARSESGAKPAKSTRSANKQGNDFQDWMQESRKKFKKIKSDISDAEGRSLNVFGNDDRNIIRTPGYLDEYPARTVASLRYGPGHSHSSCTVTIIRPWIALTNNHCISKDDETQLSDDFWDEAHILLGREGSDFSFAVGFNYYYRDWNYDYALLRMDFPIGDYTGYMGLRFSTEQNLENKQLSMISYHGDLWASHQAPAIQFLCQVRKIFSDAIYHDCDSTRGSSGSSMFTGVELCLNVVPRPDGLPCHTIENLYIEALNFAEYRDGEDSDFVSSYSHAKANIATAASRFEDDYFKLYNMGAPERGSLQCSSKCVNEWISDGNCQEECNTSECNWDGADCVPTEWTCSDTWYNANDGCDCNCGIRDPDCDKPSQTLYRCNAGEICNAAGQCEASITSTCSGLSKKACKKVKPKKTCAFLKNEGCTSTDELATRECNFDSKRPCKKSGYCNWKRGSCSNKFA